MANEFDRWQKDAFFFAAEEVQESADLMESTYRVWERERKKGLSSDDSDELRRELHTALGTTKWQLDEFEKAIKMCHRDQRADDMVASHKQFVVAIENQVSRIEKVLRDFIAEEGKQPFRWVQLDKEERDDLALFLSGIPKSFQHREDDCFRSSKNEACQYAVSIARECNLKHSEIKEAPLSKMGFKPDMLSEEVKCSSQLAGQENSETMEDVHSLEKRSIGHPGSSSSSDIGAWKIVIADEVVENKAQEFHPQGIRHFFSLLRSIELRIKLYLCRNSLRKWKVDCCQENTGVSGYLDLRLPRQLRQGISTLNERSRSCLHSYKENVKASHGGQFLGHAEGLQQQSKGLQVYLRANPVLKFTLIFLLAVLFMASILYYAI